MNQKIQSIDAARAVAALSIVLMQAENLMRLAHFPGHAGLNHGFGHVGVDFFFVLIGFVIVFVYGTHGAGA